MAAAVRGALQNAPAEIPSFLDQHFAKVALVVSALVVFFLQTLSFFFGLIAGFFSHYHFQPDAIATAEDIASVPRATMAIIAATAALLRLTPGGEAGGYIFQSITPIFSMAIGSSAFLAYRSCNS